MNDREFVELMRKKALAQKWEKWFSNLQIGGAVVALLLWVLGFFNRQLAWGFAGFLVSLASFILVFVVRRLHKTVREIEAKEFEAKKKDSAQKKTLVIGGSGTGKSRFVVRPSAETKYEKEFERWEAELKQAEASIPECYYATDEMLNSIVKDGDSEFDTIPEHELIQQLDSEKRLAIAADGYLLGALLMLELGRKSIYDIHDRRVNSILRRRLGTPTSIIVFKMCLAKKVPFVTRAWKDRLNACKEIYAVKFYRVDGKPEKGVPMEEYEYMDDKEAAEAHFERFRNDRSLLYSHIDLTVVSAKSDEKVLQRIAF